ncbi:hypothetical protein H4CHR_02878 [Variovorax sp. PBS-H4]|uniref:hypothetical protein n=1 Tax=Variovorax sp. PBS-H4 TaxID=434008 RepID=UPI0013199F8E|nr:hypothetical protein [Variovorax sp. PBS-H4]VTU31784.1 hypothetical protein H4CHR_02878 [Variovorax sp. PBS-H4]
MRLISDRTRAALAARLYGVRLPKINLRWPATSGNNLAPWYTILWRMLWWIPLAASIGLTTVIVALSHGIDEAEDFWKRAQW